MKNIFLLSFTLLSLSFNAKAYIWSSATPTEVHIVPEGLVLVGDFNNTGVTCASDVGKNLFFYQKQTRSFKPSYHSHLPHKQVVKKLKF